MSGESDSRLEYGLPGEDAIVDVEVLEAANFARHTTAMKCGLAPPAIVPCPREIYLARPPMTEPLILSLYMFSNAAAGAVSRKSTDS